MYFYYVYIVYFVVFLCFSYSLGLLTFYGQLFEIRVGYSLCFMYVSTKQCCSPWGWKSLSEDIRGPIYKSLSHCPCPWTTTSIGQWRRLPQEKNSSGRRPMRNWTQLSYIFLFVWLWTPINYSHWCRDLQFYINVRLKWMNEFVDSENPFPSFPFPWYHSCFCAENYIYS